MENEFPVVPLALLRELEALFPDRCPSPRLSDREVWMAAGAAAVVRKLREEHEAQNPLQT